MKEIKAYIRPSALERTIKELEKAGARDITVIRVDAIGKMADFEKDRWHIVRKYDEKYSAIAKLEIVCVDSEFETFVEIIREEAYTGERGDGRIFVSRIEKAISIRTGNEGADAL